MDANQFFQNQLFTLPVVFRSENLQTNLEEKFSSYLEFVRSLKGEDEDDVLIEVSKNQPRIERLCTGLMRSLEKYLRGFPSQSFSVFNDSLNQIEDQLDAIALKDRSARFLSVKDYYRARISEKVNLSREELFHISFSDRRKVSSKRFSIPGLPCLYLGSSTYVCWEELGRQDINKTHFSRFVIPDPKKVSIINLSTTQNQILSFLERFRTETQEDSNTYKAAVSVGVSRAILWPLILACSIRAFDRKLPFIPEYVLPQLLLQYVTSENRFDGISYLSTNVEPESIDDSKCINFVFPAKEVDGEYCAHLASLFHLTRPIPWDLTELQNIPVVNNINQIPPERFIIDNQLAASYNFSKFGQFEKVLLGLTTYPINPVKTTSS